MSQERKNVKIFSFVAFALCIMQLILVGLSVATQGSKPWATSDIILAVSNGISAILLLVGCVFGIRGANRPSAIDPLAIVCLIGAANGLVWTVTAIAGIGGMGSSQIMSICSGIIEICFFLIWRNNVMKVISARDNRI